MKIQKEKFLKWYQSMTNAELAKKLNVSVGTIKNLIKRYNIQPKGKGNRLPKSIIKII